MHASVLLFEVGNNVDFLKMSAFNKHDQMKYLQKVKVLAIFWAMSLTFMLVLDLLKRRVVFFSGGQLNARLVFKTLKTRLVK